MISVTLRLRLIRDHGGAEEEWPCVTLNDGLLVLVMCYANIDCPLGGQHHHHHVALTSTITHSYKIHLLTNEFINVNLSSHPI